MNQHQSVRLAELTESLPLSRASVFGVIKALRITTTKGPGPDGRGRVAYLSSADSERLKQAVEWVHKGELRIADLAAVSKASDSTEGSFDLGSTALHDLVAAAVTEAATKAAVQTMSAWLDAQMLDCNEIESASPDLREQTCADEPEARVRFTVDLPRSLHRSLKQVALNRDQPMTDLARQALAEWMGTITLPVADEENANKSHPNDLTFGEAAARWGLSGPNAIKARARALGVVLRRESPTRTVWPAADVPLGDRLAEHLQRPGATLASFQEAVF